MKKYFVRLALCLLLAAGLQSCNYNSLVEKQQGVEQSWAEVQNQYQRRADLIPNLVATVKGYASHEEQTFERVTQARAAAEGMNIAPEDLNQENLNRYQQSQNELTGAIRSIMVVAEAYPELKANENFMDLQRQLAETENGVAVARRRFTETVQDYNTSIRKFPTTIYAGWFGFNEKPQFQADPEAQRAPKVDFSK